MEYDYRAIEKKWRQYWKDNNTYRVENGGDKPKYYVLDMFPYPSGAGLHVGHPLGYIASDIYSRYKRQKGFNVLHPMGYDAFGLPAEQYAIQTGQHPAVTTEQNVKRYREQLDAIGFSFDWSREVQTCDPSYYKWTQWIFMQLFNAWYNKDTDKAEHIDTLIAAFEQNGNAGVNAATDCEEIFTAADWKAQSEKEQQELLLQYRLTYLAETEVNWCAGLGTVLSNDEVKDGYSERGGYPVERKKMQQWSMRISAYADRLLQGLDKIDWSDSIKEIQRNWIGKSNGASVAFAIDGHEGGIEVFTTRPDTIYGVTFMTLAPEHELVEHITTADQKEAVTEYVEKAKNRSERDRLAEKSISGVFTGAYAVHPFNGQKIPIWIGQYVLAGYGTGAVMAVPGHDSRDWGFAKHFDIPIVEVVKGGNIEEEAFEAKDGELVNSDILDGLRVKEAIQKIIGEIESRGLGKGETNYRLRDAIFTRQRYWGEPLPVYFKEGVPYLMSEDKLPLELPKIDEYKPTEDGEPPLARATDWQTEEGYPIEYSTMPGWAGSSWYFFRYMDPNNDKEFVSKDAQAYWENVDLYIGGAEHATGHLLYARFWVKFLYDLGLLTVDEPVKKLVNQGMIQGVSRFVYRVKDSSRFVSYGLRKEYDTTAINVDIDFVDENNVLDVEAFKGWREEFANAEFELEDGKYVCGTEVEKMSKSKYNVVNPDNIIEHYGADSLRLFEMFLGPLEQHKPWDDKGIDGSHRFIKKLCRLFENGLSDDTPTKDELKTLHKTIKKVTEDIEALSFNTCVSTFMVCVNELTAQKCNKRAILSEVVALLAPFAPHICEELWQAQLGNQGSVVDAEYPLFNKEHLTEDSFEYPVSFNGKMRFKLPLPADMSKEDVEKAVIDHELFAKYTEGKDPKKMIVVPKRIVNVVV